LSAQTQDVACNFDESQNSGGPAAIVVVSFAILCVVGLIALVSGYGILMSLLLGWVLSLAIILAGVLAMLLHSIWVDYCENRQATRHDRSGFAAWNKNIAFVSANGSKSTK
jgi:protein-S-isoprenylcysteine O-methyltransferase Ste14